jgi:hypothetical protein
MFLDISFAPSNEIIAVAVRDHKTHATSVKVISLTPGDSYSLSAKDMTLNFDLSPLSEGVVAIQYLHGGILTCHTPSNISDDSASLALKVFLL